MLGCVGFCPSPLFFVSTALQGLGLQAGVVVVTTEDVLSGPGDLPLGLCDNYSAQGTLPRLRLSLFTEVFLLLVTCVNRV